MPNVFRCRYRQTEQKVKLLVNFNFIIIYKYLFPKYVDFALISTLKHLGNFDVFTFCNV